MPYCPTYTKNVKMAVNGLWLMVSKDIKLLYKKGAIGHTAND